MECRIFGILHILLDNCGAKSLRVSLARVLLLFRIGGVGAWGCDKRSKCERGGKYNPVRHQSFSPWQV
jgi:hypothetical protein